MFAAALCAKPLRQKSRTKLDGCQGRWSGIGHKSRFAIIEQFALLFNAYDVEQGWRRSPRNDVSN